MAQIKFQSEYKRNVSLLWLNLSSWDCSFTNIQVSSNTTFKSPVIQQGVRRNPIHKKDSKFPAQNYFPVSLTLRQGITEYPRYSTVFGKCTAAYLSFFYHINNILAGFQDEKGTEIMYLDFAKAFDKMVHPLFIKKL